MLFAGWVNPVLAAPVSPPRILVLAATSDVGANAQEVVIAQGLGFIVDVVSDPVWAAMTATANAPFDSTKGFSAYRAIILADRSYVTVPAPALNAAVANRPIWSAAATGNVIIDGEDFTYHANYGSAGIQAASKTFITNAIQFATADATKTGLFIQLSGYYGSAGAGTPVPVLEDLSTPANETGPLPNGPFTVRGGGFEKIHITAAHPALNALTDALLSNYGNSSHETFDTWPHDFIPLAIATDSAPIYSGGVPPLSGSPYIMVRGLGVTPLGACLSITNRALDCMSTNQTYKWDFCVTNTWTDPIKYLSIVDLPPGVTISKDIVTLPSVLLPGQGTCLTLYITNTPGVTNMCVTIGAHTTNFFLCCSITNCLTFEPCCVFFSGETMSAIAGTGCYNYTFTVRNVTPSTTIRYLFLVQDPAPPPSCVTFTPDIVNLPPLLPGQSATRTVRVCIAAGCVGPFHVLASAHDTNLTHCCSTRHRLPPASVIKWPGGLDGTVFEPGTILLPLDLDTTFVTPSVVTVYEGTNVIKNLEFAPGSEPTNGLSVTWSNVVAGTYTLRAQETDTLGGVWEAEPATIYVVEHEHAEPDPAPPLTGLKCVGNALSFCLATTAGRIYHIESTDSLTAPNWTLVRDVVGDGTIVTVTNTMTSAPQRFYRVRAD